MENKYIPVSLTEEFVLNYSALPKELNGWRYYRIEFGGCNESCFLERPVYLPPLANSFILDLLFDFWQTSTRNKRKKILHEIIKELEKGL